MTHKVVVGRVKTHKEYALTHFIIIIFCVSSFRFTNFVPEREVLLELTTLTYITQ